MSDITQPKTPREYYLQMYCNRKKHSALHISILLKEAAKSWRSLSSDEKQILINKFNKLQAKNCKRLGSILQCAEPFLKKRKTKEIITDEVQTCIANVTEENEHIDNLQQDIDDSISNTYSESLDDDISNANLETQDTNDNISIAHSESTNPRVYAASVIDTDLDEITSHQEIYEVQSETLTEPVRPTVITGEQLFETLKTSGARPDLANVEWKKLKQKRVYHNAVLKMKKQYLLKLEQYLESLSDRELFRYYVKTLNK